MSFPTDEMTLRMLIVACSINPDTGQTHLQDFLRMGAVEKSRVEIDHDIVEVKYEEDHPNYSEHSVITALAQELLDLKFGVKV